MLFLQSGDLHQPTQISVGVRNEGPQGTEAKMGNLQHGNYEAVRHSNQAPRENKLFFVIHEIQLESTDIFIFEAGPTAKLVRLMLDMSLT